MLSSVDLPQPDGPITATNSPGVIVKSTPRRARTGAPSDSNVLRRPCVSTTGPAVAATSPSCFPVMSPTISAVVSPVSRSSLMCQSPFHVVEHVDAVRPHRRVPPFHRRLVERHAHRSRSASAEYVLSLITMRPDGRARSCSRCARFTVSPTSVYSTRSSEPSSAAATGPVDTPMPMPNGALTLRQPPLVELALALQHRARRADRAVGVVVERHRRAEARHHRVAHELHHGAALVEDGAVHLGPVIAQLRGELRRVAALRDPRVAADVAHEHGDVERPRSHRCRAPPCAPSRPDRRGAAGSAARPAPRGRRSRCGACAAASTRRRCPCSRPPTA